MAAVINVEASPIKCLIYGGRTLLKESETHRVKSESCPNSISKRIVGAGSPASWKASCRARPMSIFTPERAPTSWSNETAADQSGRWAESKTKGAQDPS